jgi:hypothetical protein
MTPAAAFPKLRTRQPQSSRCRERPWATSSTTGHLVASPGVAEITQTTQIVVAAGTQGFLPLSLQQTP